MAERGLAAFALSRSCLGLPGWNGLLLGFGTSPPARLLEATRVLGEILVGPTPGR
jgi:hypothetical protein